MSLLQNATKVPRLHGALGNEKGVKRSMPLLEQTVKTADRNIAIRDSVVGKNVAASQMPSLFSSSTSVDSGLSLAEVQVSYSKQFIFFLTYKSAK